MRRRQIREALGSEREALLSQLTEQTVSQTTSRMADAHFRVSS